MTPLGKIMSNLNKETIQQLTRLCRIDCTEEEQISLLENLKKMVAYIEQLQEVDTEDVPPCNHVLEGMANVMREDVVGEVLDRELVLANAPSHIANMFRVPTVIKQN